VVKPRKTKVGTQMENIPTNEANGKWRAKLKKWTKRVIVLGVIYGLGWLFYPLLNVGLMMLMTSPRAERGNKLSDYYYINITGITYAKNKFYVLLSKPYLFQPRIGYIYSSEDLSLWKYEFHSNYYHFDNALLLNSDESDNSNKAINSFLPRYIKGNCYIMNYNEGLYSDKCIGNWIEYNVFNDENDKLFNNQLNYNLHDVTFRCRFAKQYLSVDNLAYIDACKTKLYINNEMAVEVLSNIIRSNKLSITIDGSHTAYGDGKYIGIFYKNKQYYFIISTDGIHYEIKPAPSKLVSSLAIKFFN